MPSKAGRKRYSDDPKIKMKQKYDGRYFRKVKQMRRLREARRLLREGAKKEGGD
jgi:hypothetical protein